jgi:hypothetical protein
MMAQVMCCNGTSRNFKVINNGGGILAGIKGRKYNNNFFCSCSCKNWSKQQLLLVNQVF